MEPLGEALAEAAEKVRDCSNCGSLDTVDPCALCTAPERDDGLICVVSEVGDVWALERAGAFRAAIMFSAACFRRWTACGPKICGLTN